MILLLHPTHRKFIRLLRDKVSKGDVIFITQEDLSEWQSVFSTSKTKPLLWIHSLEAPDNDSQD